MCACRLQARPWPKPRQNTTIASVGVSPPNLFSYFSFVLSRSSLPDFDPAIHAEVALVRRYHGRLAACISAWTTGSKSGGDEPESAVTVAFNSSGAKARRENASSLRANGSGPKWPAR